MLLAFASFSTGNWIAEFKKWCPSINAVKMGGKKEERARFLQRDLPLVMSKDVHAVVTSYEGLLKEKNKLSKIPWKYLIIDEVSELGTVTDLTGIKQSTRCMCPHPLGRTLSGPPHQK